MLRPALALALCTPCIIACGPEPGAELPVSGIYDFQTVTLENTCSQVRDDDRASQEVVVVEDDTISVGYAYYGGLPPIDDCSGCVGSYTWERPNFRRDADGRWVSPIDRSEWWEYQQCARRLFVELEVLDEQTLRTHIIQDWADAGGGCPWAAKPEGCTLVREYTYTLNEACDDCTLTPESAP